MVNFNIGKSTLNFFSCYYPPFQLLFFFYWVCLALFIYLFINAREKQIDFTDDCLKGAVKLKWLKIEHTFYMKYVI